MLEDHKTKTTNHILKLKSTIYESERAFNTYQYPTQKIAQMACLDGKSCQIYLECLD
jgi:hypothetical protein